jgi:hypothetical protein
MEGLTEDQRWAMARCWDHLHIVPCEPRDDRPTGRGFYGLDDWWAPRVAEVALAAHRRWRFGAVIANYVWFSALLNVFASDVVKVLDTHDIFGGRDRVLRESGLPPSWFFTSKAEEARGLRRADIVLAIQDSEAAHFRALGHSDVRVVGHLVGQRVRTPRARANAPTTVGYLASGNPLNRASFERLRASLAKGAAAARSRFVVAGSICHSLGAAPTPFESLGLIGSVDQFYDTVDIVASPMVGGTGLRIKSVEAVFQGTPIVATEQAMIGLPVRHPLHSLPDPEAMGEVLLRANFGPAELADLAHASRECAGEYAAGVRAAFDELVRALCA